jgi:regulator of sigma E protease
MLSLGFILSVIVGLFVLIFLVVVHELGHAIAARRNGVVVEEFGIGFPPKAWGKKLKNGVLFTINWLPLGGFVKLQGEHDAAEKKGDYGAASFWVKTKILLAGVMINWLTAVVIFTVLALVGLPKIIPNQFMITSDSKLTVEPVSIDKVVEGSPPKRRPNRLA